MKTKTITRETQRIRRNIAISSILAVLLIALLVIYYVLTQPPQAVDAAKAKGFQHVMSIYGYQSIRLSKPNEIAVAKNGDIYILDADNHRVVVFDEDGNYVKKFGEESGQGSLNFPTAIAIDSNGVVFVAVKDKRKIVMFDAKNHEPFWEIKIPAPAKPQALTTVGNRLYVATDDGVMIGTTKGRMLTAFRGRGRGKGEFDLPTGIAVRKGKIYIADSGNYRLQALNSDGESLWTVGEPMKTGAGPRNLERKFGSPAGLTIDDDGNLYMVDGLNGEIHIFDEKGQVLKKIGSWGRDDGQLYYPDGIAYAGGSRFVVADKFNNRVQVFRIALTETPVTYVANLLSPIMLTVPLALLLMLLIWRWYSLRPVLVADPISTESDVLNSTENA